MAALKKLAHLRKTSSTFFELLQQLLQCVGIPNSWTSLVEKYIVFGYQPQNGPFLINLT
jgi:hypothetical protein